MKTKGTGVWLLGIAAAVGAAGSRAALKDTQEPTYYVHPIGHVRIIGEKTVIEIEEKYRDALLGLDGFSHVHVLWWFHQNDTPEKRRILRVHPRGNVENPLTGVFATRAPMRPNPIALTVCKIAAIEDCRIHVEGMDAFDGSPVLDLKPYVPTDRIAELRVPQWAKKGGSCGKPQK
ncbi:MAG: tRNA (N6-threonylcarbamoyladenosine(37)-N6)-methyltransferase TrmO [Candidatus Sumerlaeia bacterium]|nr:tRNA (N6-threonylcarbamoyladenosine(37)-N6)-methyltransferase TrmO [Candidatus Sumerlaeia bacterium]